MAGAIGIVVGLPSLRVRHDFLAVTTMGIGFVFLGFVRKQKWRSKHEGAGQRHSLLLAPAQILRVVRQAFIQTRLSDQAFALENVFQFSLMQSSKTVLKSAMTQSLVQGAILDMKQ